MTKKALLIIDYINGIVHSESKIASSAQYIIAHNTIEKVNHAIEFARQNNLLIIFVKVGFSKNYVECPIYSPLFNKIKQNDALLLNTWDTEFCDNLDINTNDLVIIKHRVSVFYATALDAILRANQIQEILISGVSTNMAVAASTYDAHDRDYQVTIIEDACAAADEEVHRKAIELLSSIANIIQVKQLEI